MNERGLWVRFIHRSGSAALTQQDRLRKCSLTIVAARTALTRTTQQTGQHHDQQQPESSGQKLYVPGVDRGSPKELLDIALASGTTDPHRELHRDLRPSWCLGSFGGSTLPPNRIASGSNAFVRHILRRMLFQQVAIWQVAGRKEDRTAMLSVHFAKQGQPMQWPVMPCGS